MKPLHLFSTLLASAVLSDAAPTDILLPTDDDHAAAACTNGPDSRQCWGDFSVDTNWYTTFPDTGVVREYWLSAENTDCFPDGYKRTCMTFNGSIPGPSIFANWGDDLVIHVTNNLIANGTAIHWHGLRQLNNVENDGVPGVTQCPIAPGDTMTYKFKATQYGSTWYHSHFTLQYAEGLYGPLIINGPATASYDEDLGPLFLQDWSHTEIFTLWDQAQFGVRPTLENGLINGTNTFNCKGSKDPMCMGDGGNKFTAVFRPGKRYLIRVFNVAVEGLFQFSIDGHKLKVIASDLVPIKPYDTDSVLIATGQRYDIVVEANAKPGNYWLRAGWVGACAVNLNPDDMTAIVRYDANSKENPTSQSTVAGATSCIDEPIANLVPQVPIDVKDMPIWTQENLGFTNNTLFHWTINSTALLIDWDKPTLQKVLNSEPVFPTEYNVVAVDVSRVSLAAEVIPN
jgi:hypothetical protein